MHLVGFEPRIALESNESGRIRSLVSRGLGVAMLPRSDAVGSGAPIVVADLVEPALERDVTLAWRDDRPAFTRRGRLSRNRQCLTQSEGARADGETP